MNRKRRIAVIVSACLVLVGIVGGIVARNAIARKNTPQFNINAIPNRTTNVKPVSLSLVGDKLTLIMRNASKKVITAVIFGNAQASLRLDFGREDYVSPDKTFSETFIKEFKDELLAGKLAILGVIYNDDTYEGDQKAVEKAFQWRAGAVREAKAMKELISSIKGTTEPDLVQALKARIAASTHPHDDPELKDKGAEKAGAHTLRERVEWLIEDHEKERSAPDVVKDSALLSKISEFCDSQISLYEKKK